MLQVTNITNLNPRLRKVQIKARVMTKTDLKRTERGPFFKIVAVDGTGRVPLTFWDNAATTCYSILQENSVYLFLVDSVQDAGQYGTPEMPMKIDVRVASPQPTPVSDTDQSIPHIADQVIRRWLELMKRTHRARVTIQGRIIDVSAIKHVRIGAVRTAMVRTVIIGDMQGYPVAIDFWDEQTLIVTEQMVGQEVCLHELSITKDRRATLQSSHLTVCRNAVQ
jgi:hypothetical protein